MKRPDIKIKLVKSDLNIDVLTERLLQFKDCCGRFEIPDNGRYKEFRVLDVKESMPNQDYRKKEYLISEYRDNLEIVSLADPTSQKCVHVNLGGDAERWGKTYKFGISELNNYLNTKLVNIRVSTDFWQIENMLQDILFENLILID